MSGYVYILASRMAGTLYTGVTSDLVKRVAEHKNGITGGFTSKYGVYDLVWFQEYGSIEDAINQEKKIKKWRRQWKIQLIEKVNPKWEDLFSKIAR